MAGAKTQPTDEDPRAFIDRQPDPQRRADCHALLAMMEDAAGAPAVMWGPAIMMGVGAVIGGQVGARLAARLRGPLVLRLLALALFLSGARLAARGLGV